MKSLIIAFIILFGIAATAVYYPIQTDATLTGDGTVENPLSVSSSFSTSRTDDYLAALKNTETAITTTATATISTQHLISGTSSNYTITLPAASGNTGKFIGFRISPTATKLFTIDGNASETIDGATTRIMWAGESATLYCDGSNWFKVAGKSIPMTVTMESTGFQSIANSTVTTVTLESTLADNTGLMADLTNDRATILRSSVYSVYGICQYSGDTGYGGITAQSLNIQTRIHNNGTAFLNNAFSALSGSNPSLPISAPYALTAGDLITLRAYQVTGAGQYTYATSKLSLAEIPTW